MSSSPEASRVPSHKVTFQGLLPCFLKKPGWRRGIWWSLELGWENCAKMNRAEGSLCPQDTGQYIRHSFPASYSTSQTQGSFRVPFLLYV